MTGYRSVHTELGELGLEASATGLQRIWLPDGLPPGFASARGTDAEERILDHAEREFAEYFAGERRVFEVPLDWSLASNGFAGQVQRGLGTIPYGETASYGEVADMFAHPRAARAVGSACATNPLPIISPCHRVVRAGGHIGLYGGGEVMKRELLELERRAQRAQQSRETS